MRGKHYKRKRKIKKNVFLAALSLFLVVMTAVTTTVSWIEDVSQVEFSSTEGQETPLHVGSKILSSDMVMQKDVTGTGTVNLNDFFYQTGDMHLSPCYGDGENFYFPLEGGASGFRIGTKDDANVNYLSTTFRIRSDGAPTAYWFEKTGETEYITFKKGTVTVSGMEQYLRISITVDGATNVYALNNSGTFNTVTAQNNGDTVTPMTGRRVDQYTYYQEQFNADGTSNTAVNDTFPNQGAGDDLNGNTLFNVSKYDAQNKTGVKTVTVKLWLEYQGSNTASIDISSINFNMVSSWAKTRRIYVEDHTIDQFDDGLNDFTGLDWLTNNATLHWGLKDNAELHWDKVANISDRKKQYFDLPAVYNNAEGVLYRCENGWNTGNNNTPIKYWDKYETIYPNTFHSETFAVYTKTFGTWDGDVHYVKMLNSCNFSDCYAYMWDSSTVYGTDNKKVVENANWYGVKMLKLNETVTTTGNTALSVYGFYYNSDYDYIIFNDAHGGNRDEYQTQDLAVRTANQTWENKYFDIATLTWFNSSAGLPSYGNNYLHSNFVGEDRWVNTRFAWKNDNLDPVSNGDRAMFNNTDGNNEICRMYIKNSGSYQFSLKLGDDYFGANSSDQYNVGDTWELKKDESNLNVNFSTAGVYRFYLKFENENNETKVKIFCVKD